MSILTQIGTGAIKDNAVTENKINNNAVTENKINNNAVTADKINDGSIGLNELSATGTKDATTFLRGDNTYANDLPKIVAAGRKTTSQTISNLVTINYDTEILDTYSNFDETTGIFTADANTVGWYEVKFFLRAYSLQSPNGESSAFIGIYKNDTSIQARANLFETTNPDETEVGLVAFGMVNLANSGDNIRVKCQIVGSSAAESARNNTCISITRLTT